MRSDQESSPASLDDNNNSHEKQISPEDIRLGSKPPLKTIIILSIGPLISQVTNAVYGIVNTMWVAKACGDKGLAAISTYNNFDTIRRAFALFLQVAASAKFANLFGQQKNDSQLFSDLLRMTILCGIVASGVFLPLTRPTARWFGATKEIEDLGYDYIFPLLMSTIVPCVYLLCCGCLQAEGRAWAFCIVQVSSMLLNMLVFAPFFLLLCKTGIAGVAYATILAELLPALVLLFLFYRGKHFTIKPKLNELIRKFSTNFLSTLSIGISQLLYQLSLALPGFLIRKYFGVACEGDSTKWNNVMAGFNASIRYYILMLSVTSALTIGYVPAASYAYAARRYKRFLDLTLHITWISVGWSAFTMIFTVGFPRLLTRAFSNSEGVLHWGEIIVRRSEYAAAIVPICIVTSSLLQSMQMGKLATLLNCFTQLIPLPIFSTIMFFTNKKDVARLILAYPMYDVFSFLVSIPFIVLTIRPVLKKLKESRENEESPENDDEEKAAQKKKKSGADSNKAVDGIEEPLVNSADVA